MKKARSGTKWSTDVSCCRGAIILHYHHDRIVIVFLIIKNINVLTFRENSFKKSVSAEAFYLFFFYHSLRFKRKCSFFTLTNERKTLKRLADKTPIPLVREADLGSDTSLRWRSDCRRHYRDDHNITFYHRLFWTQLTGRNMCLPFFPPFLLSQFPPAAFVILPWRVMPDLWP